MWPVLGFIVASSAAVLAILIATRRRSPPGGEYPWVLDSISNLHVAIVGTLAGFAFTGVVLVVTLAHERTAHAENALDTVIVMFLVAYLYWVGAAFLISYAPNGGASGNFVQRVHFSLASTIEYRTVFLSWFALLPLLEANGLGRLAPILYVLLPLSLLLGSLLVAMATDGLGLMTFGEIYLSMAIGTTLTFAYAAIVAFAYPSARSTHSALNVALVIFYTNGFGFALAALTSLSPRYRRMHQLYERYGRAIVIGDMQITMVSLAFLWLAVVGVI